MCSESVAVQKGVKDRFEMFGRVFRLPMIVVAKNALLNPRFLKNRLAYTLRKARPVNCCAQIGRVEPRVLHRSGPWKHSIYDCGNCRKL